ncbi:MAG: segregation/condensation protein A [Peptostreptococcaceae bacterium]|nr:segregation/condensation protein A [Peptostreptococcaceae bacterium]
MAYKVKLDMFEGPFDLLVYLIENSEMNIYDIQVALITKQYLEHIEKIKALDVAVATEFMVLAAVLIEIKSKMLLPRFKPEGELGFEDDPRAELVEKILEYKKFKQAAELLDRQEEYNQSIFEKPKEDLTRYTREPDEYLNLDINQFAVAFTLFLNKKKRVEEIKKNYSRVERQKLSIEDKIKQIFKFIKEKAHKKITFNELLGEDDGKYEKIVTFMSVLEMIRLRAIHVNQTITFGDITISMNEEKRRGSHDK